MIKREVVIFFSQTSARETIQTDAATWGDLKSLIRGSVNDKTCVLSGSKHLLALDDATLPEGKMTVFVYPKESKGGAVKRSKKAKKPVKRSSKVAKKATKSSPAKSKKSKAKVAKASKKRKSAGKTRKPSVKPTVAQSLGSVVSSVEAAKVAENERLEQEANEIGRDIRGYR